MSRLRNLTFAAATNTVRLRTRSIVSLACLVTIATACLIGATPPVSSPLGGPLPCFALLAGTPLLAIALAIGTRRRRREVAVLRTVGWRTVDLTGMVLLEQAMLATFAACVALPLGALWSAAVLGTGPTAFELLIAWLLSIAIALIAGAASIWRLLHISDRGVWR